ncbi:MAG: hypothetical protein KKA81_14465 [Bacteroidetes bacterium]|nr:hypothetical protein [Bacteroidota bacterium]
MNIFRMSGNISRMLVIVAWAFTLLALLTVWLTVGRMNNILSILLLDAFLFAGMGLFAGLFFSMHTLGNAHWINEIRFELKGMMVLLIAMLPAFAFILFFLPDLYPWFNDTELSVFQKAYFQSWTFVLRNVMYFTVWVILLGVFRRYDPFSCYNEGIRKYSAVFLVFTGIMITPFSWDWLMSLDIHWHSTLYGWYVLSGILSGGTAFLILVFWFCRKKDKVWKNPQPVRLYLARYLFAFSIVWMYLWYVQFFLVWYANLPGETIYYIEKIRDFPVLFYLNPVLGFLIPFILLISVKGKKNELVLLISAFSCLLGQWIDRFLLIW